jgi:hypothetical protein
MSGDAPFSSKTPAHISLPFFVAAKSAVIPSSFRLSKDTLKYNKGHGIHETIFAETCNAILTLNYVT